MPSAVAPCGLWGCKIRDCFISWLEKAYQNSGPIYKKSWDELRNEVRLRKILERACNLQRILGKTCTDVCMYAIQTLLIIRE